jgi:hypothetical protein
LVNWELGRWEEAVPSLVVRMGRWTGVVRPMKLEALDEAWNKLAAGVADIL